MTCNNIEFDKNRCAHKYRLCFFLAKVKRDRRGEIYTPHTDNNDKELSFS